MKRFGNILLRSFVLLLAFSFAAADKPCIPRKYNHNSVVCVCNGFYCDEISKIQPVPFGKYVAYTSNLIGLRFEKTEGNFIPKAPIKQFSSAWDNTAFTQSKVDVNIQIHREIQHQSILGFGGAFTDAAGINIKSLSQAAQRNLMNSYFSENGLEYNMGRVPIGGCDFSTYPYAYNMKPENDFHLTNYSLTQEDFIYKIPYIKEAMKIATSELLMTSAAWSPPPWMKNNNAFGGNSRLLPQYYQTWADYHLKFLQLYALNGVPIWGMSTGNEPLTGMLPVLTFNSMGWEPEHQGWWLANNLGPTIRNSPFSKVKLLAIDDQRISLPIWLQRMSTVNKALDYVDGIASHWYLNDIIPVITVDKTRELFSDKFFLATEACLGDRPWQIEKVELGSWTRAEYYIKDIIEVLNHYYTGWIDWNLALNRQGGPNWFNNFVDSPIIVFPESDEFAKQPMFYALGHFSKFIPRGSKRVSINMLSGKIDNVAFLRPDGGITVVISNMGSIDLNVQIEEEGKGAFTLRAPARSVQSIVYW